MSGRLIKMLQKCISDYTPEELAHFLLSEYCSLKM